MDTFNESACTSCSNNNCFIKQCALKWIRQVEAEKGQIILNAGQNLFTENSTVTGVYFVQQGKLKVYSTGIDCRKHIVRLAGRGHIVGHRGQNAEQYPIGASTIEHSVLCFIDNSLLYKLFMHNPRFTYTLMMFYSEELRLLERRLKYLSQMTVREKIIEALFYVKRVFGLNTENILNVQLNRSDVAALAGINIQQVSRFMGELEKEGLISRVRKSIRLNSQEKMLRMIAPFNNTYGQIKSEV